MGKSCCSTNTAGEYDIDQKKLPRNIRSTTDQQSFLMFGSQAGAPTKGPRSTKIRENSLFDSQSLTQ